MTYKQAYENATADDTPVLWKDMTPEQKGALLLAHHEKPGSVEFWNVNEWETLKNLGWHDEIAYRIKPSKPEPKAEIVTMYGERNRMWWGFSESEDGPNPTHRITFNLIDGKPDCGSVKMTPINE